MGVFVDIPNGGSLQYFCSYKMGVFPFQNSLKDLDLSSKMDLDLWNCFRGTCISIPKQSKNLDPSSKTNLNLWKRSGKKNYKSLGPVVQSIFSFTSSLRGQLIKCFTTLEPNTLIFFLKK